MALYRPGQRSNTSFLTSSIVIIVLLTIIIAGHLVIIFDLWFYFTKGTGMKELSALIDIAEPWLWISVVAALIMDVWVVIYMRKGHQKAERR
ncbi:MAG: hypothetical protein COB41_09705 [Proteobacteria bacterium]|nr:hypothetical protein [bacterium AH-315-G11]PCI42395.1 MAG: hypothetical protein COB41_09705 [Pseudomonadota bacterium]